MSAFDMHDQSSHDESATHPQEPSTLGHSEDEFQGPCSNGTNDHGHHNSDSIDHDESLERKLSLHSDDSHEISQHQKICYGALCHVKVHIDADPRKINPANHFGFKRFKVSQRHGLFGLMVGEKHVASLNLKVSSGLQEVVGLGVQMDGFVQSKDWISKLSDCRKASKKSTAIVEADIVLYGDIGSSNVVGRYLSNSQLFLQPPEPAQIEAALYQNPHWLWLPSCVANDVKALDAEGDRSDLSFLDNTPQVDTLQEAQIDLRVTTTLKPHQKTGVDFIIKKETATLNPSMNLWQMRQNEAGMPYYLHILSGETRDRPLEECEGGVLADDVGLGKTLTMISALVGSLNRGAAFASSKRPEHKHLDSKHQSCSATLVIVPSGLILDGWGNEIHKHTQPGTLKVHKYHGGLKEIAYEDLKRKDVVLTTYSTVESDARQNGHRFFQNINWFRLVLDEGNSLLRQLSSVYILSMV
ncbi:MAG: hypothetical protein M1831_001617 [Alyxoria varia]|nr:MAG: hypothetical protein M1831_001617 [Alyxoria varia]